MTYAEQYEKAEQLSEHFHEREFLCTCRGRYCSGLPEDGIDPKLVTLLETIRELVDSPITLNSGYRCPKRNRDVGGAKSSQHMNGTAADITASGLSPSKVRRIARKAFRKLRRTNPAFKGLGFGLGKYSKFTHVDTRRNRARW